MTELKLCPFCDGKAGWDIQTNDWHNFVTKHYRIECDDCGAGTKSCFTEEDAIEAWNKRVK